MWDNKLAINIVHNPMQCDHTKHIEVDNFIKQKLTMMKFLFHL